MEKASAMAPRAARTETRAAEMSVVNISVYVYKERIESRKLEDAEHKTGDENK
jgi:hypothetical protein